MYKAIYNVSRATGLEHSTTLKCDETGISAIVEKERHNFHCMVFIVDVNHPAIKSSILGNL